MCKIYHKLEFILIFFTHNKKEKYKMVSVDKKIVNTLLYIFFSHYVFIINLKNSINNNIKGYIRM